MNLEEFVAETLKQVVKGVKDAKEFAASAGCEINPRVKDVGNGSKLEAIEFDVAVTATEDTTKKGGIKVFGFGAEASKNSTNQSVSRVKFAVPIYFP